MGAPRRWMGAQIAALLVTRPRLTRTIMTSVGAPRLYELYDASASWSTSAEEALAELAALDPGEARTLIDEARTALEHLEQRADDSRWSYPASYRIETETALLLYAIVRLVQPHVAVETGVADGVSSALILAAMDVNGRGKLHSIDIANDVGGLVTDRARWMLHVVDDRSPDACAAVMATLPTIDLFLHDGNHERAYQASEYRAAWSRLVDGGLLLSDDVDWSYAFLDFVAEVGTQPTMLMDRRKVFGALRKWEINPST